MTVDGKKLRALVEHYGNLEADKKLAAEDQAQLLKDAEEEGFDKAAINRLIRKLRKTEAKRRVEQEIDDDYLKAYLDFDTTPLGAAAKERDDTKVTITAGDTVIEGTVDDILEATKAVKRKARVAAE